MLYPPAAQREGFPSTTPSEQSLFRGIDDSAFTTEEVHRFPNKPFEYGGQARF